MPKFKPGDEVICIVPSYLMHNGKRLPLLEVGHVYTVNYIDSRGLVSVIDHNPYGQGTGWGFEDFRFKLLSETTEEELLNLLA